MSSTKATKTTKTTDRSGPPAPPGSVPTTGRPKVVRLVHSEYLKLRTTNAWWLFVLGALAMLVLAILFNWLQAHYAFNPEELSPEDAGGLEATSGSVYQAANLYTSGQYFGVMFVMLVGIIIVTSEFHHQTATSTFLTTPHRTAVILAKLAVAALFGAALWLVSFLVNLPATVAILSLYDQPALLGEWAVQRSILLNLLAYGLWGALGIGLGVLIRSQIAATVVGTVVYLVGTTLVAFLLQLLHAWLGWGWLEHLHYAVPSVASALMVQGESIPGEPPFWVGALILVGWGVVTGLIGTLVTRRRDIS